MEEEIKLGTGYTKGDKYQREILLRILNDGCLDINPRPHYSDGTPAHTLSVNHGMCTYDLAKGESPLVTLRPIATKKSIGEILWIYQDQSNDLNLLKDKYGVTWWDDWDIGNRTIGIRYGATVKKQDLVNNLLNDMAKDPDGRRHCIDLWQEDDFKESPGLKPCAYRTDWNIRHGKDGKDYLDMCLHQRSSDFITAGSINQTQYVVLQHMIARHFDLTPGNFTWFYNNIQIYDRHLASAKELISRDGIECHPHVEINKAKTDFYSITQDDIKIVDYPMPKIKEKNPQMKFELGI
jgi:thymidylate synthase